jgi:hypothetical protein
MAALEPSAPDLCMGTHEVPASMPEVASAVPVLMLESEAEPEDVLFIRGTAQRSTIRHSEKIFILFFNFVHCNEKPIYAFPKKELRGLSPNFHIHVSVSERFTYSLDRSTYFPAAE